MLLTDTMVGQRLGLLLGFGLLSDWTFTWYVIHALDERGLGEKYWREKERLVFEEYDNRRRLSDRRFVTGDNDASIGFIVESAPLYIRARAALTVLEGAT